MDTIIIQTTSKSKLKLFMDIARHTGVNIKVLDKEIIEDLALGKSIQQTKTDMLVSKNLLQVS